MPTTPFLLSAALLAAPVPAEKPSPPTTPEGRWHGVAFEPKVSGPHPERYTLAVGQGRLTLAGGGTVLMSGVVEHDPATKALTYTPQAGKAWGKPVPGTYSFRGELLSWTFRRDGEGAATWTFRPAWAGPPVRTSLKELAATPGKFSGKLVEVEAAVAADPLSSEADGRTTHELVFAGEGSEPTRFDIRVDGEPAVRKGDAVRLVGRFEHRPTAARPLTLAALDPDCKVERATKAK